VNRTVLTVLKAIVGLLVLFVLLYTVSNWWQEYRSEAAKPRPAAGSKVGEGSGQKSEQAPEAVKAGTTVVVLVDGLNLREEPSSSAKAVQGLEKGEKVVVIKQDGEWYEVKTDKGKTGWISSSPSYSRVENP
jgi:uncharacterized protein YgiM (DUF1202 family)